MQAINLNVKIAKQQLHFPSRLGRRTGPHAQGHTHLGHRQAQVPQALDQGQ